MAAFFGFVEVDQVVVCPLGPVARRVDILFREHRNRGRRGEVGDGVEVPPRYALLPVQPRRGRRRVREPVQRGVVEPVVTSDSAERVSGKQLGEVLVGGRVVVKKPGRQADGVSARL